MLWFTYANHFLSWFSSVWLGLCGRYAETKVRLTKLNNKRLIHFPYCGLTPRATWSRRACGGFVVGEKSCLTSNNCMFYKSFHNPTHKVYSHEWRVRYRHWLFCRRNLGSKSWSAEFQTQCSLSLLFSLLTLSSRYFSGGYLVHFSSQQHMETCELYIYKNSHWFGAQSANYQLQ